MYLFCLCEEVDEQDNSVAEENVEVVVEDDLDFVEFVGPLTPPSNGNNPPVEMAVKRRRTDTVADQLATTQTAAATAAAALKPKRKRLSNKRDGKSVTILPASSSSNVAIPHLLLSRSKNNISNSNGELYVTPPNAAPTNWRQLQLPTVILSQRNTLPVPRLLQPSAASTTSSSSTTDEATTPATPATSLLTGAARVAQSAVQESIRQKDIRLGQAIPRKRTSQIWAWFNVDETASTGPLLKCKFCDYSIKYSSSTSGAIAHALKCSGIIAYEQQLSSNGDFLVDEDLGDGGSRRGGSGGNGVVALNSNGSKSLPSGQTLLLRNTQDGSLSCNNKMGASNLLSCIRGALVEMLIIDELPFNHVEGRGFKNLMQVLRPQLKLPGRQTVRKDLMEKVYPKLKGYMKDILNEEMRKGTVFSTTTDIWTAPHINTGFMAITIHYVDAVEWEMRNFIIAFEEVTVPHSGFNIAMVYKRAIDEFGIGSRILSCTLDNASNNTNFVSVIKSKMEFLCKGEYFHSRCNCHIINLIVQDGLQVLKPELTALRKLVKHINTPKQMATFNSLVENNLDSAIYADKKRPKLDVCTRWNSTFDTIESCLPYAVVLNMLMDKPVEVTVVDPETGISSVESQRTPVIEQEGWDRLEAIAKILKPLKDCTEMLSIRNDAASHCVMPCIDEVRDAIDTVDRLNNSVYEVEAADTMAVKFAKYYSDRPKQFVIAHVLDPRTKLEMVRMEESAFNFQLSAYPSSQQSKTELYRSDVRKCFNTYFLPGNVLEQRDSTLRTAFPVLNATTSSTTSTNISAVAPNRSFLQDRFRRMDEADNLATNVVTNEIDELDRYLSEPRVQDTGSTFEILKWWKNNAERFPILSVMAKWFLTIQASSVASESAFSTSGRVLTPDRASMKPETLKALMLCESWLKSAYDYHWKMFGFNYE